jgi:hypothetical protein
MGTLKAIETCRDAGQPALFRIVPAKQRMITGCDLL